jgi:hypothetical protein
MLRALPSSPQFPVSVACVRDAHVGANRRDRRGARNGTVLGGRSWQARRAFRSTSCSRQAHPPLGAHLVWSGHLTEGTSQHLAFPFPSDDGTLLDLLLQVLLGRTSSRPCSQSQQQRPSRTTSPAASPARFNPPPIILLQQGTQPMRPAPRFRLATLSPVPAPEMEA